MISIFCKLKRDKLFLSLCIVCLAVCLLDIALIIFDVIEIVSIQSNSAAISNGFLAFNLFVFAANVCGLIFSIIYFVLKSRTKTKLLDKK